jgi:hypothetical protein
MVASFMAVAGMECAGLVTASSYFIVFKRKNKLLAECRHCRGQQMPEFRGFASALP